MKPHGVPVRGSTMLRTSLLFEGPFGRIFRALPPAEFGATDERTENALADLADAMLAQPDIDEKTGLPKEGPDGEESGIPAAFTYFGQFIDHDLTFDPASSLQRQNDPQALVDYRTPRFDLDSVYGRGPDDQPYLYDDKIFALGDPLTGGQPNAQDLPRSRTGRAIIGDPRNDENVIVSQLQGLFLRFHNRVARDHPQMEFAEIQQFTRFHYQWIVLSDFLTTIVDHEVLRGVAPHLVDGGTVVERPPVLRFFHTKNEAFMPLEFSAAAYRFGHSMVRPGYRLNDGVGPLFIFDGESHSHRALGGFRKFPANWALDWARFIDLHPLPAGEPVPDGDQSDHPNNRNRLQLAYRIDTSLVNPLAHLPPSVAGEHVPHRQHNLAFRNLVRGWRMRLPSGQAVARAMGLVPLPDAQIKIGKFEDGAWPSLPEITTHGAVFADNCPLWTYILAETIERPLPVQTSDGIRDFKVRRLGPVGGTIVAETFLGLMQADSSSYLSLDPRWTPKLGVGGRFGLREFVAYALDQ